GSSDVVIGKDTCDDAMNAVDEYRTFGADLSFMCSENNFCTGIHSDSYSCSFTCGAWNCDEGNDEYEVLACGGITNPDPGRDAWDQLIPGCKELAQDACSARGEGCQIERPCYFKDIYGGRADSAVCKCSCPYKGQEPTTTAAELEGVMGETFDIASFNFESWERENKTSCWGKSSVVNETKKGRSIIGKVGDTLKAAAGSVGNFFGSVGGKVKGLLGRSKLPFSSNAQSTANLRAPAKTNESIRAALMGSNACDPTNEGTGDDSGPKPEDFVIIGSETDHIITSTEKEVDIVATGYADANPLPPAISTLPVATANKCIEDWSCSEYGNWSGCSSGKADETQFRSRARKCADKNSCKSFEGKPKTTESEKRPCNAGTATDENESIDTTGACTENWSCGEFGNWGACSSGTQSRARTCSDGNSCGTTSSRPALSESRACTDTVSCTESWSCGEWAPGEWGACQENGTRARPLTRVCTDASNCGTTASKPSTTSSESGSCDYAPTEQKPDYSSHVSSLGSSRISELSYAGGSAQFNTAASNGEYGYKILSIPAGATVKICVQVSSGSIGYNSYPQYHYGYDWSTPEWEAANPGCITAYNKNAWANGMLLHLGSPTPATAAGTVTVSLIS
ncbi:MAG TPA: hypothetical protein VJH23_05090, partial [archaeon]|nr:hypothetical protein [archaeon]